MSKEVVFLVDLDQGDPLGGVLSRTRGDNINRIEDPSHNREGVSHGHVAPFKTVDFREINRIQTTGNLSHVRWQMLNKGHAYCVERIHIYSKIQSVNIMAVTSCKARVEPVTPVLIQLRFAKQRLTDNLGQVRDD